MPSYSNLLKDISNNKIDSIIYIPLRREVYITNKDGSKAKYSVLPNDQKILRLAEETGTSLEVKDIRQEQILASSVGNFAIVILFISALLLVIKRSANIANKSLGFLQSNEQANKDEDLQTKFHDVAGISEALDEIKEIVSFLKSPEIFEKLGAKIPKGFLLIGPPGTGKTLLAKAIAGEAQVPFYSIAASEFVELFVGVGASRVRNLFRTAKKNSPSIIFIDEIDSIGRQRGSGIGGGNDEREQTLNQLLTEIDGFSDNSGVIIIGATNRPDVLDLALTRPGRFDRKIEISLPDRRGREEILFVHARSKPLEKNACLSSVAINTVGFSGADLSNLLNEAAIFAARHQNKFISNNDLNKALDKLTTGLVKSPLNNSVNKTIIAYNEIGRAIVGHFVSHGDNLEKISILPRANKIGGFSRFVPDEETLDSGLITKGYLFSRIIRCLGGRAAEVLIFGDSEITQVATKDIEEATDLAREMVMKYGFSHLGPISLDHANDDSIFLGRSLIKSSNPIAQNTVKAIDKEVMLLLREALARAIEILKPYTKEMDKLSSVLVEEEVISSKKFIEIANLS